MRKLAIGIALASTMLATPAVARDGSLYAGIEGGLMLVEDLKRTQGPLAQDSDGAGSSFPPIDLSNSIATSVSFLPSRNSLKA